ncbi:MAG: deoxyhypusine synthase [Ignavibacteriae bacterium]|nr:deoxyhypusine synthase [Ignavibacteria bacterium]MBI3363801.1 deoxyhypusine synthase [Ignavibacteriota bacterium]
MKHDKRRFLKGSKIVPKPIPRSISITQLVDEYFQAYNAGRLREAAQLLTKKMLSRDTTVGMSITGALTPAGLGGSCIVPLIKAGFVDWIVSTGANLYHDTHFAIGHSLHRGSPFADDRLLRQQGIIRIYDIVFDYDVLLSTDTFFKKLLRLPEFQTDLGTAELHYRLGKYVAERERVLGIRHSSVLATAYRCGVPIYTSSPGDSSIGMNIAEAALDGCLVRIDVLLDVNETAAIVLDAKRRGGKSGVLILGGGSPKNFVLQTEPQIQEVLGINEKGHDYFLQVTDARPDTGGLSGATPGEAVTWGKVDPDRLPDAVVAYVDSTIALPLLTSYVLAKAKPRPLKRLYDRREALIGGLYNEYMKAKKKKSKTKSQ